MTDPLSHQPSRERPNERTRDRHDRRHQAETGLRPLPEERSPSQSVRENQAVGAVREGISGHGRGFVL